MEFPQENLRINFATLGVFIFLLKAGARTAYFEKIVIF